MKKWSIPLLILAGAVLLWGLADVYRLVFISKELLDHYAGSKLAESVQQLANAQIGDALVKTALAAVLTVLSRIRGKKKTEA